MRALLGVNRRNLATLCAVTLLLGAVYLVVPHPVAQYGAWLAVFAIWMGWFVLTGVEWLGGADV